MKADEKTIISLSTLVRQAVESSSRHSTAKKWRLKKSTDSSIRCSPSAAISSGIYRVYTTKCSPICATHLSNSEKSVRKHVRSVSTLGDATWPISTPTGLSQVSPTATVIHTQPMRSTNSARRCPARKSMKRPASSSWTSTHCSSSIPSAKERQRS